MIVFDCEGNGLEPSKFWCMSKSEGGKVVSTTSYKAMRSMLSKATVLIGHNITLWDIPHLERVLDIKVKAKLVDTLAISWYLYPKRVLHGLESWGEDFGIPKPKIVDWDSLTVEEYIHRCEEDVKINQKLWDKMWSHLVALYGSEEKAWRLVDYLSFKVSVVAEQEGVGWLLDKDRCEKALVSLSEEVSEKKAGLASVMPKVAKKASKSRPKKPYKINGELSAQGLKWQTTCEELGVPFDYDGELEVITGYDDPNPGSHVQVKSWLFSLGWEPETFNYKRDKETGDVRKIEQINAQDGGGVCPSIKRLYSKQPQLELLDGLSVLSHRISILKGFLSNVDANGYVKASMQGLTNTLRLKHRVCVNLPGVNKPYGELIRGCLIAPSGYKLCGSDMSSLEDRTKQHYMWDYDKDYVLEMTTEDFDPHLDLAVAAGAMSQEQANNHKTGKEDWGVVRHTYKQANYSCVYGAGGSTVARAAGIATSKGDRLVEAYWKRNWSVRAIADAQEVKVCRGQKWLYNPVSRLWYSLRHEKDRFSTLNQGTGVWCFDTWVKHQRDLGLVQVAQFHDETINLIKEGEEEITESLLKEAIKRTNDEIKLNRKLDIDVQFGYNYSEIH